MTRTPLTRGHVPSAAENDAVLLLAQYFPKKGNEELAASVNLRLGLTV
jgi:hypothetical protein